MAESLVSQLIPAYWLKRFGCEENSEPLEAVLAEFQKIVELGSGRMVVQCSAANGPSIVISLILSHRHKQEDAITFYCFHDQDPRWQDPANAEFQNEFGTRIRRAQRVFKKFCLAHVKSVKNAVPSPAPKPRRTKRVSAK